MSAPPALGPRVDSLIFLRACIEDCDVDDDEVVDDNGAEEAKEELDDDVDDTVAMRALPLLVGTTMHGVAIDTA